MMNRNQTSRKPLARFALMLFAVIDLYVDDKADKLFVPNIKGD